MAAPAVLSDWYSAQAKPDANGLLTTANNSMPNPNATPSTAPDPNKTTVAPTTYQAAQLGTPNQWNVTDNQTTQGQLKGILASGSPLMQQADTKGLQQANSRGLLNSSMAVGASENSMIAAATPIAQADADLNARAAGYNTDTANKFTTANVDAQNTAGQYGATAINHANEFNASNAFNKQQSLFDANVKSSLDQINNQFAFTKQTQDIVGGLSNNFAKSVSDINTNVNMNQVSKDYSIKQLFANYKAQISLISAVGSIPDVSTLLTAKTPPTAAPTGATGSHPRAATAGDVTAGTAHKVGNTYVWNIP